MHILSKWLLRNRCQFIPRWRLYLASVACVRFQSRLVDIMRECRVAWTRMSSRMQQEGFRARVTRILQAWADWAVYPTDFLLHINDVFLGQNKV